MSLLVESLKRLYVSNKVTDIKLKELIQKGTITEEEYQYIVNQKGGKDVYNFSK